MIHRTRVADFWDAVLTAWQPGDDFRSGPLTDWIDSYQGTGKGAVDLSCYPDPYCGDLRGVVAEPRLVFLGLNPGEGHPELQGGDGIWTRRIKRDGYSRTFERHPEGDPDSWIALHGKRSPYWLRLEHFVRRWTRDASATCDDVLGFELYPWHSNAIVGVMKPPARFVEEFIWQPISEIDVPVVFAFGAPWFASIADLGLPEIARFGVGGDPFASPVNESANWRVGVFELPSGQRVVASAQSGYAGPPGAIGTENLRATLERAGHLSNTLATSSPGPGRSPLHHTLDDFYDDNDFGDREDDLGPHLSSLVAWPAWFPLDRIVVWDEHDDGSHVQIGIVVDSRAPHLGGQTVAPTLTFPTTLPSVEEDFKGLANDVIDAYRSCFEPNGILFPVPDPWLSERAQFNRFALSYPAPDRLFSDASLLASHVLGPVQVAHAQGSNESIGLDLLRGALWVLATTSATAGSTEFDTPEEEDFWRWIIALIDDLSGGQVVWCGELGT